MPFWILFWKEEKAMYLIVLKEGQGHSSSPKVLVAWMNGLSKWTLQTWGDKCLEDPHTLEYDIKNSLNKISIEHGNELMTGETATKRL